MKHQYYIFLLLFLPVFVSCGGGGGGTQPTTVQYTVTPKYVDKNGNTLSSSIINGVDAFLFVNSKFYQTVSVGTSGSYVVSFDNSEQASLVVLGNVSNDSLKVITPAVGDNIDNVCIKLATIARSTVSDAFSPSYLFYGKSDYTSASTSTSASSVSLYNQRARLHVVISNLKARFGTGNYTLKLEGFRNGITFSGKVSGDSVAYTPAGSFDSSGNYVSDAVNVLPTMTGEYVTLTILKDGSQQIQITTDTSGSKVTLSAEDDKAMVVDLSNGRLTLQVMPWSTYLQNVNY